ncbi:MAG: TIGR02594 family protein [Geminicoccaceae bacterium]
MAEGDRLVTVICVHPDEEPAPEVPSGNTVPAGWMKIARAEEGVGEAGPGRSNPRIESYHATTSGGAAQDSVPWCSSFVNYCITKSGLVGTNSKLARSWAQWGADSERRPGSIVVLERGRPPHGHVGFFVGRDDDRIRLLGGNQGDRVSIASYEAARVIAVRWPVAGALAEPAGGEAVLAGVTAANLAPPRHAFDFETLRPEYQQYFAACLINDEWRQETDAACARIEAARPRYVALSDRTGVPWHVIGLLHHMESGCNFDRHLHNGDPLAAQTVREPKGRPVAPPANGVRYTWEESAEDALIDVHSEGAWSIERLLFHAERYNGWGYRTRTLPSAYLWSGSNLYVKGKFVRDGVFDPEAPSGQLGVATVLRRLADRGALA